MWVYWHYPVDLEHLAHRLNPLPLQALPILSCSLHTYHRRCRWSCCRRRCCFRRLRWLNFSLPFQATHLLVHLPKLELQSPHQSITSIHEQTLHQPTQLDCLLLSTSTTSLTGPQNPHLHESLLQLLPTSICTTITSTSSLLFDQISLHQQLTSKVHVLTWLQYWLLVSPLSSLLHLLLGQWLWL